MSTKKSPGEWKKLLSRFWRAFADPWSTPLQPTVFFVVILFIGGLGCWIPAVTWKPEPLSYDLTLAGATSTYALAILASVFADMSLGLFAKVAQVIKSPEDGPSNFYFSTEVFFWVAMFGLTVVAGVMAISALWGFNDLLSYRLGAASLVAALVIWWLVNNDNERYRKETFESPYDPKTAVEDELAGGGIG